MHSVSGAWKEYELPTALALLLGADLGGARQREGKRRLDVGVAGDIAADVADQPAKPGAQDAQFSTVAVELLGMGIASRHHRRAFGNAEVGLPQLHAVLVGQPVEAFDRFMQQLGVGWEGDVLGLHRGVDRDPYVDSPRAARVFPWSDPIACIHMSGLLVRGDRWPRWFSATRVPNTPATFTGQWVPRSVSHLGSIDPTICLLLQLRLNRLAN